MELRNLLPESFCDNAVRVGICRNGDGRLNTTKLETRRHLGDFRESVHIPGVVMAAPRRFGGRELA